MSNMTGVYDRFAAWYRDRLVAKHGLGDQDLSLPRIARDVGRLSLMFTGQAEMSAGYMDDLRLRAAYALYYLYPNMLKVVNVLRELTLYDKSLFRGEMSILDVGCGPGTSFLASAILLGEMGGTEMRYVAVDRSPGALTDCSALSKAIATIVDKKISQELKTCHSILGRRERFDLIIAANSLGEAGWRTVVDALRLHLKDDGYAVIVQPALSHVTKRLMESIETFVSSGYKISAPCLGARRCPMLGEKTMWCHMDEPWEAPPFMRQIDQRCGLRKESLKYSYLVLTRTGGTLADIHQEGATRIVSSIHNEKGKVWMSVCPRGADRLDRPQFLKRDDPTHILSLRRGDIVRLDGDNCSGNSQSL